MKQVFRLWALAIGAAMCVACDGNEGDDDLKPEPELDAALVRDGGADATIDAALRDASTSDGSAALLDNVTIRFRGKVGNEELVCGRQYAALGTTRTTATPQDFRFYVQEVRLINSRGQEVPVRFDERSPHQAGEVALIDFTDGAGSCRGGAPTTNMVITGTVPRDTYDGLVFVNGVPPALNNAAPGTAPAPLKAPGAHWGWRDGYRYMMAELLPVLHVAPTLDGGAGDASALPPHHLAPHDAGLGDGGSPHEGHGGGGASFVHSGSTGCTGTAGAGIACNNDAFRANRAEIRFAKFDHTKDSVAADLAAVFAAVDLAQGAQCHGTGAACAPMFSALGIDPQSGLPSAVQSVFRVE